MNPSEDIKHLCRLCGIKTKTQNRLNIFDSYGLSLELKTKILNCLSIDINEFDTLPKFVCTSCTNNLDNFYHFKIKSHRTNCMLQDLLFNNKPQNTFDNVTENSESDEEVDGTICEPELVYIKSDDHESNTSSHRLIKVSNENPLEHNTDGLGNRTRDMSHISFFSLPGENQNLESYNFMNTSSDSLLPEYQIKSKTIPAVFKQNINKPCNSNQEEKVPSKPLSNITSDSFLPGTYQIQANKTKLTIKSNKQCSDKSDPSIGRPFICNICHKNFVTKRRLYAHIVIHISELKFGCSYCDKKFKTNSELRKHIKRHEKSYDYICNYCGKGIIGKQQFESHVRTKHTKELPFQCSKCDKKFANKFSLTIHEGIEHDENRIDFVCDICNKIFKCKYYLNAHKKSHIIPVEERRKYKCNVCSASFMSKPSLTRHLMSHTGETPYECDICKNSYKCRKGLKTHLLTHSGVKKFICDFCGKAFALKHNLETHRLIHTGERKYKCKDCGKSFTQNSSLNRHKKSGCTKIKQV